MSSSSSSAKPAGSRARNRRLAVIAAVVVVAALLLAILPALGDDDDGRKTSAPAPAASGGTAPAPGGATPAPGDGAGTDPANPLAALERRDPADPRALGAADAPVVLIEYSDFQCPFCGKFARDTKPELISRYVDKGLLRLEWRDFPIFGEESERAARGGQAAALQGRFWQFHDIAYGKERRKNTGEFSEDKLVAMAREAGVPDLERFRADLRSDATEGPMRKEANEGLEIGVPSTPAFLINGEPVLGAQPTKEFTAAIDEALKKAGR